MLNMDAIIDACDRAESAVPLQTLAIRLPAYAVAYARFLFTPSFIRFFALFCGVFHCFHMHIRNR